MFLCTCRIIITAKDAPSTESRHFGAEIKNKKPTSPINSAPQIITTFIRPWDVKAPLNLCFKAAIKMIQPVKIEYAPELIVEL